MSLEARTAFINFTLVMSCLSFLGAIIIGYVSGASFSTIVLRGLLSLVAVGGLGWLVLKLLALYPLGPERPRRDETDAPDEL